MAQTNKEIEKLKSIKKIKQRRVDAYLAVIKFTNKYINQPKYAVWGFQLNKYNNKTKKVSKVLKMRRGFTDSEEGYFYGMGFESFLNKITRFERRILVFHKNETEFLMNSLKLSKNFELLKENEINFKKKYKVIKNEKGEIIKIKIWTNKLCGIKKQPNFIIFYNIASIKYFILTLQKILKENKGGKNNE